LKRKKGAREEEEPRPERIQSTGSPKRNLPVYKKLEIQYEIDQEEFTLASKKKRLEELRSMHQPVNRKEITDFSKKY
jgi:hypothetical protein